MYYFPLECACSRGFFIAVLYWQIFVNSLHPHACHIGHTLLDRRLVRYVSRATTAYVNVW